MAAFSAGIYCPGEPVDRAEAPGTASGSINIVEPPSEFVVETQRIPAVPGVAFGVLVTLKEGLTYEATIVSSHPPFTGLDVAQEFWSSTLDDGQNLNGFTFEHDYELQPGTWTYAAMVDGELIYSVEFEVVDPAFAPELAGICAGFVMS